MQDWENAKHGVVIIQHSNTKEFAGLLASAIDGIRAQGREYEIHYSTCVHGCMVYTALVVIKPNN